MANVKITDLPSLTGASSASVDVLPVVNIAGDVTSKMTRAEFFKNVPAMDIVGAITTGSWNGATITAPYGGTGITSYAVGDLVYASTTTALSKLADIATGNALISGGVGVAPSYGKIGLTTHISGTLPVANGGTNITSYTIGDILFASTSGTLSPLADVATGNVIISGGVGVAPSYGKVGLTTHVSGTLAVANGGTGVTSSTGSGSNVLSASPTFTGTAAFTSLTATGTVSDQIGNVRDLVNNNKTAAYVPAATDNGSLINITTGGITINTGVFSAGQNVTIYNNSSSAQTITQGAGVTMYLAGTATTGNRTLAQRGIATILCVAANTFVCSGAGVT